MKKIFEFIKSGKGRMFAAFALAAAGLGVVGIANASSTDVPSATSTLALIMNSVIGTTVSLATTIFTQYWPYILVIGVIIGLIAWLKKLVSAGHK